MEVTCDQCNGTFNVPDNRIPKDQRVRIGCPKCKNKIILDVRETRVKETSSPEGEDQSGSGEFQRSAGESTSQAQSEGENYGYSDYSEDKDLDFVEEGTKLALVMTDITEHAEKIRRALGELGFRFISSQNTRDAIGRMRFHHFDVVILSDGFDGQELGKSPIINYLNRLSMSVRRKIFVALVSDEFKTLDNMMAFALSANVVINTKDIDRFHAILKKAISDNEKFYKIFNETMVEVGKA